METMIVGKKYICGFRPSGRLHLGHYFSVIKPALKYKADILIAEYHSPENEISQLDYLYKLFDVDQIKLQSDSFNSSVFFELLELSFVAQLQRNSAYTLAKNKTAHLLTYPVLMAEDIKNYDYVCVGEDQAQNIELARDLLKKHNAKYKRNYKIPQAKLVGGRL